MARPWADSHPRSRSLPSLLPRRRRDHNPKFGDVAARNTAINSRGYATLNSTEERALKGRQILPTALHDGGVEGVEGAA